MSWSANFHHGGGRDHHVSAAHDGEAGRRASLDNGFVGVPAGDAVKAFGAAAMQAVINARGIEQYRHAQIANPDASEIALHQDAMRCFATALTQIEGGLTFAVKGVAIGRDAE